MKPALLLIGIVVVCVVWVSPAFGDGNIRPPDTAFSNNMPVATMKTLNQLEPRQAILSLPFDIVRPGSYYITTSLTGTNGHNGITIVDASDVKIDLNGFALNGVEGSYSGILATGDNCHNISVINGVLRNWEQAGLDLFVAAESTVSGVTAFQNTGDGIIIGINSKVTGCGAFKNAADGISVGDNGTITDCKCSDNDGRGIYAEAGTKILECFSRRNGTIAKVSGIEAGRYASVMNCVALENGKHGIHIKEKSQVEGNTSGNHASGAGIYVEGSNNRIEGNSVSDNLTGIALEPGQATGNLVVRNVASGNSNNLPQISNNAFGPVVTAGDGTIVSMSPWANFDVTN
jgi:parallel beta-helix repeat protein